MVQQLLKTNNLDAILVSDPSNIIYFLGRDFGFSQKERECFILITNKKKYLITDGRYSEAIHKTTQGFEVIDSGALSFIANDHSNILNSLKANVTGIEKNNLTVSEFEKLNKHISKIKNIDLSRIRILKQKQEIENIKKACHVSDLAFKYIIKHLKVGVSERKVADEIEKFINSQHAEISFKPIVGFGKNSSIPHHQSGNAKLKKNSIVLLDLGAKVNNYCSDMSRTIFFGSASAEFKKIHKAVLDAQSKAIAKIEPGIKASEVDRIARDDITSHGYPDILHSVGHGIGIEVHEAPFISPKSKDILQEGMVFSVEPGIYIPNYGGVRIEDIILVTKQKAELISCANREIIEVNAG